MTNVKWKIPDVIKPCGSVPQGYEGIEVNAPAIPIPCQQIVFEEQSFRTFKLQHVVLRDKTVLHFFTDKQFERVEHLILELFHTSIWRPRIEYVPELDSFCVVYYGETPECLLRWVNQQVKRLEEALLKVPKHMGPKPLAEQPES